VLVVSVVSAFVQGFFVEVFSLAGVILGLFIAAANYGAFAPWVMRMVQNREAANLIAFLLIALLVMLLAGIAGRLLRGLFRKVGLGIVDRLLGAIFGLVKGCIVVTLVLMAVVAFLPRQNWLVNSRLAPAFLTAAHGGSHVVPFALGEEIRQGLEALRISCHPPPERTACAALLEESRMKLANATNVDNKSGVQMAQLNWQKPGSVRD
jgi:membrane protein required for colicin V production